MKTLTVAAIACAALIAVSLTQVRTGTAPAATPAATAVATPTATSTSTQISLPCSTGDSTVAWNAAIARATVGTDRVVHLYACTYHFYSPPDPISHGAQVQGQGMYTTYLERDYSPGHGCARAACAFITTEDYGDTIRDLAIFAARGTSGGWGLHAISSDARKGNALTLDNVYISGYGTYSLPVYLDGRESVTAPAGIRKVNFTNVTVFNGTWHGFECWNCVAMGWYGGGLWQGFGTTQDALVGGPLSAVNMIAAFVNGSDQYWSGNQLQ